MRRVVYSLLLVLLASPALADTCPTGWSSVQASKIIDLGGSLLTSGTIAITGVDSKRKIINFGAPGGGAVMTVIKKGPVSSGAIIGTICVPRSDLSSAYVRYHIVVTDNGASGTHAVVIDANDIPITSDVFSLDAYPFPADAYANPPNTFTSGHVNGDLTVTGTIYAGTIEGATAANANHANTADTATLATTATNATNAGHATTADSATSATNATHATSADSATTASTAAALADTPSDCGSQAINGINADGSPKSCIAAGGGNPSVGNEGTMQSAGATPGTFKATTPVNVGNTLGVPYSAPNYIFGDSTSDGSIGCSSYATCWAGLLTGMHGGSTTNYGVSGASAADMSVQMITHLPIQTNQANTVLPVRSGLIDIGINDATGDCTGTDPNCQANYTAEQNAMVAIFETAGSSYMTQAGACTKTGAWTADVTNFKGTQFSPFVSTTNGNSFSCSITTTGNGIALEYVTQSTGAGTADCRVDAGTPQTINFFPYIATVHSAYAIFRSAEIAATAGTHTFGCTITSATSATNPVEFIAVDSIPVGQTSNLPPLILTNVTSISGSNDAASLAISNLVQPIVTAYQAEGANVFFADIRSVTNVPNYYSPSYAPCPTNPASVAALSHGNDCYHAVIANMVSAVAPNVYVPNLGQREVATAATPFRYQGTPLASSDNGRGLSGGNAGQLFSGNNALSPGAWCWFANNCIALGSFGVSGSTVITNGSAISRINSNTPLCFASVSGNPIIETNFAGKYTNCWTSSGDYFMNLGGSILPVALHVGLLSRENSAVMTGSGLIAVSIRDINYVGPLTGSASLNLGGCLSAAAGVRSPEYTFYRHGTDGFSFTLTSGGSDNINSGSVGNSYVWNALEGDKLTLQCSAAKAGGSTWTISTNSANAGTLSGTTLNSNVTDSSLTSVGALVKLNTKSFAGTGTATLAPGNIAQAGTGATAVCSSGYVCDSVKGTVTFTTGTGALSAGDILTVTPGITRSVGSPSCLLNISSPTFVGIYSASTTTTLTVSVRVALAPSTGYIINYLCGGN